MTMKNIDIVSMLQAVIVDIEIAKNVKSFEFLDIPIAKINFIINGMEMNGYYE